MSSEVVVAAAVFGLFFLLLVAAMIAGLVFWIMKIVEVAGIPEPQYRAAGTDKTVWVLVVVLVGWLGALIWQFAKRDEVLRARGLMPLGGAPGPIGPPPGWYPEFGTGWFAYWDGYRWSGARQPPQQPTSALPGADPYGQQPGWGPQQGWGQQQGSNFPYQGQQPNWNQQQDWGQQGGQPGAGTGPSLEKRAE
jgi:hypothetical protein